jgi:hypothetical protein
MSLITLVYASVAKHSMSDQELKALLDDARYRSTKRGITGMLLYRNGVFLQALEGEAAVVDNLYAKIQRDERHTNVLTVYRTPIAARAFCEWSMGFNKIEDGDGLQVEGFAYFLRKPDPYFFADYPNRAAALLQAFSERIYF